MEFRRRRTTYRKQQGTAYPATIAALVVFALVVYGVGASKAGTWLAKNVAAPLFTWISPVEPEDIAPAAAEETQEPAKAAVGDTVEIIAPACVCYALQMGAYESQENAETQANSLREVGAAGYVWKDDTWYRVLAAGYATEADRDSVAENLSAQGVDSRAYTISYGERVLTVTSNAEQAEALKSAVNAAAQIPGDIYDACIAFDKTPQSIDEGKAAVREIRRAAEAALTSLEDLSGDGGEVAALRACLNDILLLSDDLLDLDANEINDTDDTVAFSSGFKRFYLLAVEGYGAYLTKA